MRGAASAGRLHRRAVLAAGFSIPPIAAMAQTAPAARFPADFLWGAATAGHQVEGNNVNSDV